MKAFISGIAGAVVGLSSIVAASAAMAGTFANSDGGDGYLVFRSATDFDIYGSDNGASDNYAYYVGTATTAESLSGTWNYQTFDCCGAFYDPAYAFVIIGGGAFDPSAANFVEAMLSPGYPEDTDPGFGSSGTVAFNLNAGDEYGFYVYSADSAFGRGELTVTGIPVVPEPATWGLMLLGFGGLGALARRRRRANA